MTEDRPTEASPPAGDSAPGSPRRTVFWKVAAVLVVVQVATALLAVALSSVFAQDRSEELLVGTLRLRLDAVATEVEERAAISPFGEIEIDERLRSDLGTRFPDPSALLDEAGEPVETFGGADALPVPPAAMQALDEAQIAVDLDAGWALAPILAPDGLPAGALFVSPLDGTVAEEQRGTREAFRRAVAVTVLVATVLALLLGALFAARLLRPVRDVTRRVERLGEGDYADRLPEGPDDEMGRLARAVNEMAARVEASIESLRDTDRLRRELVANVGHDLRTPLAALRITLDEAERFSDEGRHDEVASSLDAARRQAEGAADLVADLFELSVLDAPGQSLRIDPVPVGELVRDVATRHRAAFESADIDFTVDAPAGLPTVPADGARLVRALSNLLDNARRHTPAGGRVLLAVDADGHEVTMSVHDSGEGIAPDVLPHVFERYYRGGGARTRGTGTGLGLAIARAVAETHGGTLTAESEPGAGATFRLVLPYQPRDEAAASNAENAAFSSPPDVRSPSDAR